MFRLSCSSATLKMRYGPARRSLTRHFQGSMPKLRGTSFGHVEIAETCQALLIIVAEMCPYTNKWSWTTMEGMEHAKGEKMYGDIQFIGQVTNRPA